MPLKPPEGLGDAPAGTPASANVTAPATPPAGDMIDAFLAILTPDQRARLLAKLAGE